MLARPWLCPVLLLLANPALADDAWTPVQKDVQIPMRDWKTLAADVYLPKKEGKYPCVLIQTPYDKKHLGAPISGVAKQVGEVGRGAVSATLGLLDRKNYAYVVVDWRGFHASKPAMRVVNRLRWRRGLDGYDCVEWCAKQPWSNGKIGTWGGSALGKIQLMTAAEKPPHLVCCVPLIANMGQRYANYYPGGVLLEGHTRMLDLLGYGVSRRVRARPHPDAPLWRFAKRLTYRPQRIGVPCLFITGWWDHFPDLVIETFEDVLRLGGRAARDGSKLIVGPWDHVGVGLAKQGDLSFPKAKLASAREAKRFLDFHLRGVKNRYGARPQVRYWQCNEAKWVEAKRWSTMKRVTQTFDLRKDGTIAAAPAPGAAGTRSYTYDPRRPTPTLGGANLPPMKHGPTRQDRLLQRSDVLVYKTAALTKPLRLAGNARLKLTVSCNRVDVDMTARLCDLRPDGSAYLVADAVQRAKLRNGTEETLTPGAKVALTLRFPAHAYTFQKGHALLIVLGSGNWPRYERNPHTGADHWERFKALDVDVSVHHDPKNPVQLLVPRKATDYAELRRGRSGGPRPGESRPRR